MSNYPPGAEHDPRAPWNQRDNEACPKCYSTYTEISDNDSIYENWECCRCGNRWWIQIARDPDDIRDQRRDDALTGD